MRRYYKVGPRHIRDVKGVLYEYDTTNQRDADYGSLDKRGPRNYIKRIPFVGHNTGGIVGAVMK